LTKFDDFNNVKNISYLGVWSFYYTALLFGGRNKLSLRLRTVFDW